MVVFGQKHLKRSPSDMYVSTDEVHIHVILRQYDNITRNDAFGTFFYLLDLEASGNVHVLITCIQLIINGPSIKLDTDARHLDVACS